MYLIHSNSVRFEKFVFIRKLYPPPPPPPPWGWGWGGVPVKRVGSNVFYKKGEGWQGISLI